MPDGRPPRHNGWLWVLLIVPAIVLLMVAALAIRHMRQPATSIRNGRGSSWYFQP